MFWYTRQYILTIRMSSEESTEMLESSHGTSVCRNIESGEEEIPDQEAVLT